MRKLKKFQNPWDTLNYEDPEFDTSDIDKMASSLAEKQLNKDLRAARSASYGGFPLKGLGGIFSGIQNVSTFLSPALKRDNTGYSAQQAVAGIANKFGLYGQIFSGIYSGLSSAAEGLNLNSNLMTKKQGDAANVSSGQRFLNNLASLAPFAGVGGKTQTAYKSDKIDQMSGGFAETVGNINTALTMGDQRYAFGSGASNSFIGNMNSNNEFLTKLNMASTLQKENNITQELSNQYFNRIHGVNGERVSGKRGMKLLSKEDLNKIYHIQDVSKFQNGGSILIPDGSLHAHKNHIEDSNPELAEDLTKKGIPVIITDENSEVEQVAEIEKEEMILEKSLTDKIEDLRKEGTEEAMIEAGKIIVDTLFNNCDDNADLVKGVE